jgi:hypothetical protein
MALRIGEDLDTYWTETPAQLKKRIEVYNDNEERRAKEMDYNNYNLGRYIAYAVNDPKKYPRRPFSEKIEEMKPMTAEEMERVMRKNTIMLGGVIK